MLSVEFGNKSARCRLANKLKAKQGKGLALVGGRTYQSAGAMITSGSDVSELDSRHTEQGRGRGRAGAGQGRAGRGRQ